jgi:hypothetical protein
MPCRHMGGEEVLLLLVLNLGTRWGWAVSITPWLPFTPRERTPGTHWTGGWVGPRASLDAETKRKVLVSVWDWIHTTVQYRIWILNQRYNHPGGWDRSYRLQSSCWSPGSLEPADLSLWGQHRFSGFWEWVLWLFDGETLILSHGEYRVALDRLLEGVRRWC